MVVFQVLVAQRLRVAVFVFGCGLHVVIDVVLGQAMCTSACRRFVHVLQVGRVAIVMHGLLIQPWGLLCQRLLVIDRQACGQGLCVVRQAVHRHVLHIVMRVCFAQALQIVLRASAVNALQVVRQCLVGNVLRVGAWRRLAGQCLAVVVNAVFAQALHIVLRRRAVYRLKSVLNAIFVHALRMRACPRGVRQGRVMTEKEFFL